MRPDRWHRVQELYFRAVELPADRRRLFLDTTCLHDPEIRQEVESLLQCEGKIEDFLEPVPMDIFPAVDDAVPDETEGMDDFIGRLIDDRYLVTQRVGSGNMGIVYRADHRLLGTAVAIKRLSKELRDSKEHRRRAVEEARRAVRLDHENIARVKDVVEESNEVFVVMEFIDGHTLKSHFDQPVSLEEFLDIATQCASALAAAHEKGIAHLDIKPANIMLTASGRVKVCDFGMARQLPSAEATHKSEEVRWAFGGTPAYMAPEVFVGNQFDVRADVFSLGVVFYELLSGKHPFSSGDIRTTTNRILNETPPPLRETGRKLPVRLIRLVERMLSKDPADRLTSAEALHELRVIRRHRAFWKEAWRAPAELIPLISRKPIAASLIGVVLLAASGVAYYRPLFGSAPLPDKKYVAMLPFRIEGKPEQRHYAEGVLEMLTRTLKLTAAPGLRIEPASSIRDGNIDTFAKAAELGATIVLDGRFRFSDDQVTFEYSLIRAADGRELRWGVRQASVADAAFQMDVIRMVSASLEVKLKQPGFQTDNPQAGFLYLQGLGRLANYHDPKDLDAAVELLSQTLALDSKFPAAWASLGEAYWHQYEYDRQPAFLDHSKEACERARDLVSGNSDAEVCVGRVYQQKGLYRLAREHYERAIQYSGVNHDAYLSLASVLEHENRLDEAEKTYNQAIELEPEYWAPHQWLGRFYFTSRHDYRKAIEEYTAARELSKGNFRALYSVAIAFGNLGKYDTAVSALSESIRLQPDYARSHGNLGVTYLRMGDYARAVPELEKAVELNGRDYILVGNLARIHWLMGEREKARAEYELAIAQAKKELETDELNPDVNILLGRYYAMLGKRADAKSAIDLALQSKSHDTHFLLIAATAYAALKEPGNALFYLEQAEQYGCTEVEARAEPELKIALEKESRYIELMARLQQPDARHRLN